MEVINNHSQGLVLLPQYNDPYAYDEEVTDDGIGLVGNIDLPVNFTGEVKLHHDSQKEDEQKKVQENKKDNKRKWKDGTRALEDDWIGKESRNPMENFPQILNISKTEL